VELKLHPLRTSRSWNITQNNPWRQNLRIPPWEIRLMPRAPAVLIRSRSFRAALHVSVRKTSLAGWMCMAGLGEPAQVLFFTTTPSSLTWRRFLAWNLLPAGPCGLVAGLRMKRQHQQLSPSSLGRVAGIAGLFDGQPAFLDHQ